MKLSLHTVLAQRILMIAGCAALLLAACSKGDDVVAPCDLPPGDAETRSLAAGDQAATDPVMTECGKGGSLHTRGSTVSDPGDGTGINDDGDDEADGEGNKKRRLKP